MVSVTTPVTSQSRDIRWPWLVLLAVLLAAVIADGATIWQHSIGLPQPYPYWLETSASEIAYGFVGAIICIRVRGNALGPIMLAIAVLGAVQGLAGTAALSGPQLGWPTILTEIAGGAFGAVQARGVGLLGLLLMLAPTGRPLSPRWRWPIALYVAVLILGGVSTLFIGPDPASLDGYTLDGAIPLPYGHVLAVAGVAIGTYGVVIGLLLGCIVLALRWFRSLGVEREQVTWVVLGGLAGPAIVLTDVFVTLAVTGSTQTSGLHGSLVWAFAGVMLPAGIAVAVLRHGLYDIDRVVSRTVSYALVTGILIALYVITVTATSKLLPESSDLGVAAATLLAATAFQPLLRRVRRSVDHRFNRTAYDAVATVEEFSRGLDRRVELGTVEAQLLDAVTKTVQPASVSLWLTRGSHL